MLNEDRKMIEGDKARMKRGKKHRQEITSDYRARVRGGNRAELLLM